MDLFGSSFVSSLGLDEQGKEMDVWVFAEEKYVVMQCSERNLIEIQQHLASISLLMQSNSLNPSPHCTSNEEMKRNFVRQRFNVVEKEWWWCCERKAGKSF